MKKGLAIFIIIILVFSGAIFAINKKAHKDIAVSTAVASKGNLVSLYSTSGTIDSKSSSDYYVQSAAKVVGVNVSVGDKVTKGETLAQLDVQDMSTQLGIAQMQYDNAQIQLNALENQKDNAAKASSVPQSGQGSQLGQSTQSLSQGGMSLDDQIQMQKNQVEIARLNVKSIQDSVNKQQKYIKSTMNGTVTAVNIQAGGIANPQMPAVSVADTSSLEVALNVNQYDVSGISVGDPAAITFNDKSFNGKVSHIDSVATKSVSPTGTDTTVKVLVDVLNNDGTLKDGYDVNVDIQVGQKNGVLKIPAEAIITDKYNNESVYVVENGTAKLKSIKTGLSSDVEVEVTSGLNAGDRVILNPSSNISDGVKVAAKDVE